MTIDKAIEIYEEGAKLTWNGKPTISAEKCQQMVEWLKDYKHLLDAIKDIREELQGISSRNYGNGFEHGIDKALEIIEKHTSGKEKG